jgi:hypothetical protein
MLAICDRNHKLWNIVSSEYPIEHEIKDTTDTDRSASYLDLHLENDSEPLSAIFQLYHGDQF